MNNEEVKRTSEEAGHLRTYSSSFRCKEFLTVKGLTVGLGMLPAGKPLGGWRVPKSRLWFLFVLVWPAAVYCQNMSALCYLHNAYQHRRALKDLTIVGSAPN